ncbi:MAG: hypothetical protein WC655_23260, partial [Candidatus Hydrogenedentales bacterium]
MSRLFTWVVSVTVVLTVCQGCGETPTSQPAAVQAGTEDADSPPKLLSAYGLFAAAARQIPNEGVVAYDIKSP